MPLKHSVSHFETLCFTLIKRSKIKYETQMFRFAQHDGMGVMPQHDGMSSVPQHDDIGVPCRIATIPSFQYN